MYKNIYVPLDNSEHSNACVDIAVTLSKQFEAHLIGSHAYAAKMHDFRFKQMEFTLPDEYLDEQELERQRKIHDSLITMGLQLISDSYLDVMERRCQDEQLPFERKMFDGRNFQVIVDDIKQSHYDLVVLGSLGMGAVKDSLLGSVCERVIRRTQVDTLVVKHPAPLAEAEPGPIVVGIDGSPQSFAGLQTAIELGKMFDRPVEAVGVYDPFLHYVMFNGIVGVLSEKASKVFKFKEQEALHEEIIDTGLAKIYQSHLEVARRVAADAGMDVKITLLPGKAFEKMLHYVRERKPWLLVLGRIGVHSDDTMDIGSNAENLLRLAPCNVLLASRKFVPPIDVKAEESIVWTEDADAWVEERVPPLVRGIARTAVHRYAFERGHSVVTIGVIEDAVGEILPEGMMRSMGIAAEKIAIHTQQLAEGTTYICNGCGYAARNTLPQACPVCKQSGQQFSKIDQATLDSLVPLEGGLEEETSFDGVKLRWTEEARKLLRTVPSGYERRRAKARMEKLARVQGLATVTQAVALAITTEGNEPVYTPSAPNNETRTTMTWTPEAEQRLARVPAGFMRDMTRTRIEDLGREQGLDVITLDTAEEAIAKARETMQATIGAYMQNTEAVRQAARETVEHPGD